ncbi:MAG: ATP-binding protein, partial [Sediminibacterium sp.]
IENNCVLSASSDIHLNKLLQEIVQNIIKHSQSRLIYYQIICNRDLVITIRDNGIGFDLNKKYTGNGLENMEWRAAEAGASLKIESDQKSGTKIIIQKQMLS